MRSSAKRNLEETSRSGILKRRDSERCTKAHASHTRRAQHTSNQHQCVASQPRASVFVSNA
ncbi:MAG: hypothetical protein DWH97_04780 [Planctomycetota bacterium]|nr:MAG: hypothetical protein DWH97_04780 [Planctomycetota bacterium]